MIKTSIENLSEPIGFDIGMSDNLVQANLLNGFCNGLSKINDIKLGNQLIYIVEGLNSKSLDVIIELSEYCKLEKGE